MTSKIGGRNVTISPLEQRLLAECKDEVLWKRSIPLAIGGGAYVLLAANRGHLSFIQKQDLERYTPTAIQRAATGSAEMAKMIISALADVPVSVGGIVVKALDAILPDEDPEVKAMKQISETGKGPESQIPSAGCGIKWKK